MLSSIYSHSELHTKHLPLKMVNSVIQMYKCILLSFQGA